MNLSTEDYAGPPRRLPRQCSDDVLDNEPFLAIGNDGVPEEPVERFDSQQGMGG